MAERDTAQQVIGDFGKTIGLDDLALDEADYCCLLIDQALVINIEFDEPERRLMLYSMVGRPGQDRAAVFSALMQANYLGRGTGGATLGLQSEPDGEAIVLSREVPLPGLDVPAFSSALERFVNMAETWTQRLGTAPAAAETSAPAPDFPPAGGIRA
jgi:Tir chaperone protein (CesT) family